MYDLDITIPILWFDALSAVLVIFVLMAIYWIAKFIVTIVTGG